MESAAGQSNWRQLLDRANAGELKLSPEVGKDLDAKCEAYLDDLDGIRDSTRQIQQLSGFGGMPSGPILERKFSLKGRDGDTSLQGSLETHIEEVLLMRQVFAKAIENYHAVDAANRQDIAALHVPEVGS
ncbi:hypothetical protein DFR70_111263 [Nocardia tenerifensis]|uniref:PE family protein n=1 Tax=Nocardia tenerifensis TaxID=228006 RepID=A0A318JTM1_9NOCA|nr:hypothetical protein [Nocardia tenerifensis]PXX59876.1 hypothetical protein DFR70_111263 [Nocardia tenerifensis]